MIAYDNASLRIEINSSNNPVTYDIRDGSGNKLSGGDLVNVQNAMAAPKTITDYREGATVTVTDLDMAKLAIATVPADVLTATKEFGTVTPIAGVVSSGTTFQNGFNGTVYIRDAAATTSGTRTAIRLVNGRSLGQNVTVVSASGVYIQGDYNTGGSATNQAPSNSSDTGAPNVTGYTRHASAVMADAVTVLSNSWNDNTAGKLLTTRVASPTTVNTAILAGDVPSNVDGQGYASGGAHNFPRFLEDWGPQGSSTKYTNFTYTGSLVEAFKSEKFVGHWQTNSVYKWPNRLWSYDTTFNLKQPPGVPTGIQYSRGRYERSSN